jgi:hypothetical protein
MLHRLNLIPLLIIPVLRAMYVLREHIVELPWKKDARTEATLSPAEQFDLTSAHTGATYRIEVQVPHGYSAGERRFPVFYTLQLGSARRLYAEWVLPLLRRGEIPEAIVVSITIPVAESLSAVAVRLSQAAKGHKGHTWADDFTFVPDPSAPAPGGHGEAFLAFIEKELMPQINARYRTDPHDRGIAGMGPGGLFAVSVSFRRPDLFRRAIAIAPRVHWADHAIVDEVQAPRADPPRRPVRLYAAVGDADYPVYVNGLALLRDALDRAPEGFVEFEAETLRGRTHESQVVPAAQAGLRFVYRD